MPESRKANLILYLTLSMAGLALILNEVAIYFKYQMLFLGVDSIKEGYGLFLTVMGTMLITTGILIIAYSAYRLIGVRLSGVRRASILKWAILYSLIPIFLEGMIHLGLGGFPYPTFVFVGSGVPMFNPAVSIYFSEIDVGIYLYPLQVLQTISSSLMAGAIIAKVLEKKLYRDSALLAYGSFAVCPFCAISSIPYGLIVTSLATTTFSFAFLNFFDSLLGLITTSLIGQFGLLLSLVYVSRKTAGLWKAYPVFPLN